MKKSLKIIVGVVAGITVLYVLLGAVFLFDAKPRDPKTQKVAASPYVPQEYINNANNYSLSLFSPGLRWDVSDQGDEVKFTRKDKVALHGKVERLAGAEGTNFLEHRKSLNNEGATINRRTPVSGSGWKGELLLVTPNDPIGGTKARNEIDVYLQHGSTVSEWHLSDEDFKNLNDVEISAFTDRTLPSLKFR